MESLKITEFYLEESQVNKGRMILVVVVENGQKFVASGDHYSPTYLTPYDKSFDTKPLETKARLKQ